MTLKENLLEIVRRIREINEEGKRNSIPSSETIYKKNLHDVVESEDRLRFYLKALCDAHYLFAIRLVEPDERLLIHGMEGYVLADVAILMRLKEMAYSELEIAYKGQYYKRKQAATIVRDLVGQARKFNNTPLGKSLNLAMMLQQFEQFMATRFVEFTETWKEAKLRETLPDFDVDPNAKVVKGVEPRRAVDSEHLEKIEEMDRSGQWGEAVDKYGVEFLVRIHLRKYEFDKVKQLIKHHRIASEKDLRFVRDTLKIMEGRLDQDPTLRKYTEEMTELRRLAHLKMNQVILAKRES